MIQDRRSGTVEQRGLDVGSKRPRSVRRPEPPTTYTAHRQLLEWGRELHSPCTWGKAPSRDLRILAGAAPLASISPLNTRPTSRTDSSAGKATSSRRRQPT